MSSPLPRLTPFLVAACALGPFTELDGGSDDAGIDAGQPLPDASFDAGRPPVEVCPALNEARCEQLVRCGLLGPGDAGLTACMDRLSRTWCGPTTWPPFVAAGAVRFSERGAADCLAALKGAPCADAGWLPPECSFLSPGARLGSPCFDVYPACTEGVCRGSTCPRTCLPRGDVDEACAVDTDCRAGLFCRQLTTSPGSGVCQAYAAVDGGCDATVRCGTGLWCVKGACRPPPARGEPCLAAECSAGDYCDDADGGPGVCLAGKTSGLPCVDGQCGAGLVCTGLQGGACVPQDVAAGAPCTGPQRCPPGLTCLGAVGNQAGQCGPFRAEGDGCATDPECRADLTCVSDGGAGRCDVRREEGAACTSSRSCRVDSMCLEGRCVRLPGPGGSCTATRACSEGLCVLSSRPDGGFVCGPLLGPGAACTGPAECASRRCTLGKCASTCAP